MEFDTNDTFLTEGFKAVQKFDPETYDLMVQFDWTISTNFWTAFPESKNFPDEQNQFMHRLVMASALGATLPRVSNPVACTRTFINQPGIRTASLQWNVSPTTMAAGVLVHEFAHREDQKADPAHEIRAHKVSAKFAKKIPGAEGAALERMAGELIFQYQLRELFGSKDII